MRRLVAGAAMVAGAALMHPMEASSQITDQMCAPVYDETQRGDASGILASLISEYAANGIEVHVTILEDGHSEGIKGGSNSQIENQIEGFSETLVRRCGWSRNNFVNVVISLDPRARGVHETSDVQESALVRAEAGFVADLRDSSTSYQDDAANLLDAVNPFRSPAPSQAQPRTTIDEPPREPIHWPHIPVVPIVAGIGSLALVAGTGLRISRGRQMSNAVKQALSGVLEPSASVTEIIATAENTVLKLLHESEGTSFREQVGQAQTQHDELRDAAELLQDLRRKARRSLWPDHSEVLRQGEIVEKMSASLAAVAAELKTSFTIAETVVSRTNSYKESFAALLGEVKEQIDALTANGWIVDEYTQRLHELASIKTKADALLNGNFF